MLPILRHLRLPAAVLCAVLGPAAAAASAAAPAPARAPGRVAFSVDGGAVGNEVDGGSARAAVALPSGGAVLVGNGGPGRQAGFYAAQLKADGSLDPSFATGGIARVVVDQPPFLVEQVVRQPDGKLVIAASGNPPTRFQLPQLVLVRLNADGSLDQTFAAGGVDLLPIQASCAACNLLALAPNGDLLVTGNGGQLKPPVAPDPGAVLATQAVVARLTPAGALDPSFGRAGVVPLPGSAGFGFGVATLANGDVVVLGGVEVLGGAPTGQHLVEYLTRLLPSGAADPTFGGGVQAMLPAGAGLAMVAYADGSVVVDLKGGVVRYTAGGVPDQAFGAGGVAQVASADLRQLLPAPGDGVVVVLQSESVPGRLQVERLLATGAVDPTLGGPAGLAVELPFGGGGSSFVVSLRPRPLPPLVANTFRDGIVVQRPGGSYLVAGGVTVSQPTGEGTGRSIFDFAAAALTPSLAPDTSFGGPATPLRATARVVAQKAATARSRHGIRVQVNLSAPGLARVVIKAHGRVVAQSVLPVFAAGPRTLPVELTTYGSRLLAGRHGLKVSASVRARDLLAGTASSNASGTLR